HLLRHRGPDRRRERQRERRRVMSLPTAPPVEGPTVDAKGPDWNAIRAIIRKDLTAVRRAKAVIIPMLAVPTLLLVIMPLLIGLAARSQEPDLGNFLDSMPGG